MPLNILDSKQFYIYSNWLINSSFFAHCICKLTKPECICLKYSTCPLWLKVYITVGCQR